ncbi:hypothetical protein EVG20_g2934 [Dentipellis fragilis]|uniref:Uncharacterized protein n=1 Tax=Dentipellis fragilis TaxID=205917 RepID=A0A4Y9Z7D6_9AGAM|nr:hypothetical protein EVG20_g2934 [Dentipellis fragilis]
MTGRLDLRLDLDDRASERLGVEEASKRTLQAVTFRIDEPEHLGNAASSCNVDALSGLRCTAANIPLRFAWIALFFHLVPLASSRRFQPRLKASCWSWGMLSAPGILSNSETHSYCVLYTMAYPNSPGGLPRSLYTDMSSMYISSPRAGHANAPPYQQALNLQRPDMVGNSRMSVPPELYSGMSSMQISPPYQSHASLPPDAQAALGRDPVIPNFGGPVHAGKKAQDSAALSHYTYIKTEDFGASPAELYHPLSPECTRYMEELDREVDAELEKSLERQLALGPHCQNTREILESHRSAMRRAEELKEMHRFLERRYKEKHPNWRDEIERHG